MNDHCTYCTFFVAGHYCGIPVDRVQEVLRRQQLTPVPLAPPVIAGLVNLRGQLVTAMDLRRRLCLDADDPTSPMNVVIQSGNDLESLLVDEMGDVLDVNESDRCDPPETICDSIRVMLRGVHQLDTRLLLLLDLDRVLDVTCQGKATTV